MFRNLCTEWFDRHNAEVEAPARRLAFKVPHCQNHPKHNNQGRGDDGTFARTCRVARLGTIVVVGGWLLLDYSSRPSPQNEPAKINEQIGGADSSQQEPTTEAAANSPPIEQRIFPANMVLTFKCEKGGHVSFGDKPCGSGEKHEISR